jgi:hypothetical protein
MHEIVNDPVEVTVDFHGKRVRPTSVRWGGRTYEMQRVNMVHTTNEGTKRVYYFSVSDTANFMKLRLDTETLEWRLVEIYSE